MKLLSLSLFLLLVTQLAGQVTLVSQLETKITDGNSRQWTLDSTDIYLGDKDSCQNGLKLTFNFNPHVIIEKICKNGKWIEVPYAWEIVKKEDWILPKLFFYDKNRKVVEIYIIQFVQKKDSTYLRLRKADTPANETIDLYFN